MHANIKHNPMNNEVSWEDMVLYLSISSPFFDAPSPSGTSRILEAGIDDSRLKVRCQCAGGLYDAVRLRTWYHGLAAAPCICLEQMTPSRAHSTFSFRNTFRAARTSPAVHRRLQGWTWQDCRFIACLVMCAHGLWRRRFTTFKLSRG